MRLFRKEIKRPIPPPVGAVGFCEGRPCQVVGHEKPDPQLMPLIYIAYDDDPNAEPDWKDSRDFVPEEQALKKAKTKTRLPKWLR